MTSPLLLTAARAWLDGDGHRAHLRDYVLDTKETR